MEESFSGWLLLSVVNNVSAQMTHNDNQILDKSTSAGLLASFYV